VLLQANRVVRFGSFEFDLASGDLWKAGRRVRLQNQPKQVLRVLLARRGELVTREELRRELWPHDTFVDFDNGLNVAVRKIRAAIGDAAPSPRFIETERAQGYRFIAPVSEESAPTDGAPAPPVTEQEPARAPSAARSRRHLLIALLALAVFAASGVGLWRLGVLDSTSSLPESPAPISLAVLPLSSLSGESEDFLAMGIPDAIITRLSSVRRFRVRPTSAVAGYLGKEIDAQDVGRRLASQYVLVGTIRATADRVRVSVQLVNASDGSSVWGDQFDVARGDLLGVEDAVAERIASALRVQMSQAERERFHRRDTRSAAAYERYLAGRARLLSVSEQGALQAIEEFEAARDLDPDYALAHAGIATAAAQLRVRFASQREAAVWDDRARQEAGRALQLDPGLAEAHVALAAVHRFQDYDWDTVIGESLRALDLNPSLDTPHLYLATAYFHLGLLEEAGAAVETARQLNPENRVEPLEILGAVSLFGGRTGEAVGHLSQVQHLSDSRIVTYLLGWALYYEGEERRAEAMLETMIDEEGPLPSNARATLAAIWAARGSTAEARELAQQVESEPDLIHHGAYGLGTAYAQLGDPATALRWLTQAATTGFPCYPWYERDPLLDPIRTDPRFVSFLRGLRRSWEDARAEHAGAGGQPGASR
jgi:TolB-like protein/DNA-binding winged helix-turn-helix (wHTH) protein